jgi:hypothetical protein
MPFSVAQHPYVKGAITGALAAAVVDFRAFQQWKNFHEAFEYQWSTALLRWLQGALTGAVAAAGLGLV